MQNHHHEFCQIAMTGNTFGFIGGAHRRGADAAEAHAANHADSGGDLHPARGAPLATPSVPLSALQQVGPPPIAHGVRVFVRLSSPMLSNVASHSSVVGIL